MGLRAPIRLQRRPASVTATLAAPLQRATHPQRPRQPPAHRTRSEGHRAQQLASRPVNFARDVVEAAPPAQRAMVTIARTGARREWAMAEVAAGARAVAGELHARGARRGGVVLTLLGHRPAWGLTLVACFRQGYVPLPCTEQLRAGDLRRRLAVARPRIVVADERHADVLSAAGWDGPAIWAPWREPPRRDAPPAAKLDPGDPCLITF